MKYIGSKNRVAKDIVPILQNCINGNNIKNYVEPFAGGFNVIDKIVCDNRLGNDIDCLPIDLIETAKDIPNFFETLPKPYPTKEHYYDVRDNADKYNKGYRAAVLLFASYNARVYGGCYGAFANTKEGNIRNYFNEAKKNFIKQLPNLKNIKTSCGDYTSVIIPNDSMVYCDPPYSSGIGYSTTFNTEEFWEWVRKQSMNNYVLVSEYNAPDDFISIWSAEIKTHMNNRGKLKKTEKLFTYRNGKYAKWIAGRIKDDSKMQNLRQGV